MYSPLGLDGKLRLGVNKNIFNNQVETENSSLGNLTLSPVGYCTVRQREFPELHPPYVSSLIAIAALMAKTNPGKRHQPAWGRP